MRVGLLECGNKKLPAKAKAKDLYISPYFLKGREYVERCYDKWFILSSKHRLLNPETEIEPYNETLKEKSATERRRWSVEIFSQIKKELTEPEKHELFFHAGKEYRQYLIPFCEKAGYKCHIPMKGKRIGEQQQIYNEYNEKRLCLM